MHLFRLFSSALRWFHIIADSASMKRTCKNIKIEWKGKIQIKLIYFHIKERTRRTSKRCDAVNEKTFDNHCDYRVPSSWMDFTWTKWKGRGDFFCSTLCSVFSVVVCFMQWTSFVSILKWFPNKIMMTMVIIMCNFEVVKS